MVKIGIMDDPSDRMLFAALEEGVRWMTEDVPGLPSFGELFLERHPRFGVYPPTGWHPAHEVYEAMFDTIGEFVVRGKRILQDARTTGDA